MIHTVSSILKLAEIKGPFQVHTEKGLSVLDLRTHQIFLNIELYKDQLIKKLLNFYGPDVEVRLYKPKEVKEHHHKLDMKKTESFILNELTVKDFSTSIEGSKNTLIIAPQSTLHAGGLNGLVNIVDRLFGPGGCPWDQAQTHESLKKNMIEETYEAIDAIDAKDESLLQEELGDVLLQPLLHTQMERFKGTWGIEEVTNLLIEKLIRRHPHVFGDLKIDNPEDVLKNWDQIKKTEKSTSSQNIQEKSILGNLPRSMPSLIRTMRLSQRAARIGFDWPNFQALRLKLQEELQELDEAINNEDQETIIEEFGDVIFTLVNIARVKNIDAEEATFESTLKFQKRFESMEKNASKPLKELSAQEWLLLWNKAKNKFKNIE